MYDRPTFYRVYAKKSTESFQSVPYVVALLSATLWLYYALLSTDLLLLSINTVACVAESVYLAVYLAYAPGPAKAFTLKLLCAINMGLFGAMVAFLQFYVVDTQRRVSIAGGVGAAFALAVFVAPLAIIVISWLHALSLASYLQILSSISSITDCFN
jgi:solute carrier family 50 (sugar transporter)